MHDKSGALVSPGQAKLANYPDQANPTYFFLLNAPPVQGEFHILADPMIYFDQEDERFWVVAPEGRWDPDLLPGFPYTYTHVQVAVSKSATPGSWGDDAWWKFDYCLREVGGCQEFDGHAHNEVIGVDGDTLYIAFLDDTRAQDGTGTARTSLMMIDKDALMGGTQATPQFIHLEDLPANPDLTWGHAVAVEYDAWDNADPVYVVGTGVSPHLNGPQHQDTITIGAILKTGSTFSYVHFPLTGADLPDWFDNTTSAAAPNGQSVVLIGRSFLHATYRPDPIVGGRLWTCHHIRESTGGANPEPVPGNFVRWYEIHTNGWPNSGQDPSLAMMGDIRFSGYETYDPSIATDLFGDIALAWTRSSATGGGTWPEFWMGVHRPFDSPGEIGETMLMESNTVVRSSQKADYCGIDPDPAYGCRFLAHSALGKSVSAWDSFVGVLCASTCEADTYADQDGNRVIDELDMLTFSNRFLNRDPYANCNGDRELGVLDFLCYRDRYEAARRR